MPHTLERRRKKSGKGDTLRRILSAGLAGFSGGFADAYKRKDAFDRAERQNKAILDRQLLTDILNRDQELEAKVASGELTPEQASAMAQSSRQYGGVKYPVPDFGRVQPSLDQRADPVRKRIGEAASPEMIPTEEEILAHGRRFGPESDPNAPEIPAVPAMGIGPSMRPRRPDIETSLGLRRSRLAQFEQGSKRKIEEAGKIAQETAIGSGRGQATVKAEDFPAELGRQAQTKRQEASIETEAEVEREKTLGPIRASNQARATAASEEAKNRVYFKPQWITARMNEAAQKAALEAGVVDSKERQKIIRETANATGQVAPLLQKLADVSERVNTREGMGARFSGAVRTARAAAGMDPDVREMNQVRSQLIRPLAVAMGVREANISNFDQRLVERGITISAFSTRTERANSLNNLRDLIMLAPLIATAPATDAQGKADYAAQLLTERRAAQDAAVKAGAAEFIDPATGQILPVIR